jgi:hypothetical protein
LTSTSPVETPPITRREPGASSACSRSSRKPPSNRHRRERRRRETPGLKMGRTVRLARLNTKKSKVAAALVIVVLILSLALALASSSRRSGPDKRAVILAVLKESGWMEGRVSVQRDKKGLHDPRRRPGPGHLLPRGNLSDAGPPPRGRLGHCLLDALDQRRCPHICLCSFALASRPLGS